LIRSVPHDKKRAKKNLNLRDRDDDDDGCLFEPSSDSDVNNDTDQDQDTQSNSQPRTRSEHTRMMLYDVNRQELNTDMLMSSAKTPEPMWEQKEVHNTYHTHRDLFKFINVHAHTRFQLTPQSHTNT
jgi:hypothetical protein